MSQTHAKRRARLPLKAQPGTINAAIWHLKHARHALRLCGSKNAADAVARAIKSAQGAERHAQGMANRARWADKPLHVWYSRKKRPHTIGAPT